MDALGWMVSFCLAFYTFCLHRRIAYMEAVAFFSEIQADRRRLDYAYDPDRIATRN